MVGMTISSSLVVRVSAMTPVTSEGFGQWDRTDGDLGIKPTNIVAGIFIVRLALAIHRPVQGDGAI